MTTPQEPQEQTPVATPPVGTEGSEDQVAWNPEWDSMFEDVAKTDVLQPFVDKFKTALAPHLKRNDERYAKISPYSQFADQGIPPEVITQSIGLVQQIDSDAPGFYTRLGAYLKEQGLTPAEVKEAVAEVKDQQDQSDDEPEGIKEIRSRQKDIEDRFVQQDQERFRAQFEQDIEKGFVSVRAAHEKGPLGHIPFKEQYIQPYLMTQINTTGKFDVSRAYQEWADMMTSAIVFPRNTPPRVTPGSGGQLPLNTEGAVDGDALNKMSRSDRVAFAMRRFTQQRQ